MAKQLMVHNEEKQPIYPIIIEDSYRALCAALTPLSLSNRRACLVTDTNVAALYLDEVHHIFEEAGCSNVIDFVVPAGESSKNLNTVSGLYETLISHHFDRNDILVALGGGVIGDLTGYAAATYLRGIRFIQLPTTLLAQVDSSVGGKTGVDFNQYKNMVGAFYMPVLVYMNTSVLRSLPERDYLSGMAEVVKYGLIMDKDFYGYIQAHIHQIMNREIPVMEYITYACCDMKRRIVEEDPREKGVRALLNMGHTIGHAVEKLMDFSLYHGECVSIGCVASAYISNQRGMIRQQELEELSELFTALKLPTRIPAKLSAEAIISATKSDKKMNSGQIRFVLMKHVGEAYVDTAVTDNEMGSVIEALYE